MSLHHALQVYKCLIRCNQGNALPSLSAMYQFIVDDYSWRHYLYQKEEQPMNWEARDSEALIESPPLLYQVLVHRYSLARNTMYMNDMHEIKGFQQLLDALEPYTKGQPAGNEGIAGHQ